MKLDIQKNVSLAQFTTFKIGGPAKFFVKVKNTAEIIEAFKYVQKNNLNFFILGGGSNLLISDKGFEGLVIKIQNTKYKILNSKLECGAGVSLSRLVSASAEVGLSGLEWSMGIPRVTVGGSVYGNAGAFGTTMSDLVDKVIALDLETKNVIELNNEECKFGYRQSIFKIKKNYLIWEVVLKLKEKNKNIIKKLITDSVNYRKDNYSKLPSAGSVFKNSGTFETLKKYDKDTAEEALKNNVVGRENNIPTGFLIEQLNLKSKQIGGAKISEEHGNFIVNTGDATAEDVIILMSLMKQKVRDNFGIQLEEEIQLIGF